ncbi:hypothetical protein BDZ97DRAFT_1815308 [Flammula alnicola]|nr:hypothetical protein BDZ97DRAFT_1815308 [Flammula alnicola]
MFPLPPFKPRPPMLISKAKLRSLRRYKIFPNHVHLPTTKAACARLRLSRKHDVAERKRRTELITLLEKQLERFSRQLSSLQAVHRAQLFYLQTLTHPATLQNDDPDTLSHSSSILSEARTMFLSQTFTLSQSRPAFPLPLTLPHLNPEPICIHTLLSADR